MLTKSFNKNYSIKEQEYLIKQKFLNAEQTTIIFEEFEFSVNKKNRFFFKKIDFKQFLLIDSQLSNSKAVASFEASVFCEFKDIDLTDTKKFIFSNKSFFNPILNVFLNIDSKKILLNKEHLMIDTSLFNVFYLNKKTINHFSKIFLTEKYNFYLFKRKNSYYLFGLYL